MSDMGKKILETIGKAIPHLSEKEKDKLLNWSEGLAYLVERREEDKPSEHCAERAVAVMAVEESTKKSG